MRNFSRRAWNESTCDYLSGETVITDFCPPGGWKVSDSFRWPSPAGRSISPEPTGPARLLNVSRNEGEFLMVSILGLDEGAKVAPIAIRIAGGPRPPMIKGAWP